MRDVLDAFRGDIPPVRRTAAYRATALVVAAAVLLLLPALYLALVAAVASLLVLHATTSLTAVAAMRSWVALVFLYVGPLVAGAVLLFFLVKPLFARRSRSRALRTLELGREPVLFAVVTRVARAVGAPEPRRIDVDCRVNASAGFGSGLGVLTGGDLVLTVGLPLAAGLTVQQFAGVLAHELGHFSQGAGMRLSYVVRAVNHWFARVVYERDDWDEALARGRESEGWLAVILLLATLCVWVTRGVLWVLMVTGHALSGFLLRQMEYDADRYEARLAGAAAFEETSRRLLRLDLAAGAAHGLAAAAWARDGRLPDDLSALVAAVAGSIPPGEFGRVERRALEAGTGLFDTHPSLSDRLASARREASPGVFHLDGPATVLFKDFAGLSRAVTVDFYRGVIGTGVRRAAFVPSAALLGGE
jgi:Zn-dependent protease with chaperone function